MSHKNHNYSPCEKTTLSAEPQKRKSISPVLIFDKILKQDQFKFNSMMTGVAMFQFSRHLH